MNWKKYILYPAWFYLITFPFLYWKILFRSESVGAREFEISKGLIVAGVVLAYLGLGDLWTWVLKPRLAATALPRWGASARAKWDGFKASQAGRFTSIFLWSALALAALAFPTIARTLPRPEYQIDVATKVGLYIILALGLNIVVGLAGVLDLGFIAFYAVGAYTWALLASGVNGRYEWRAPGWTFPLVVALAALLAGIFRLAIGWPALRLRGDYLAIVTLGFGEMMRYLLINLRDFTGGSNGITIKVNPVVFGWNAKSVSDYYFLVVVMAVVTIVAVRHLENSRIGRAWKAIREDELAASTMGINTPGYLLLAYVLGGLFAGIAGAVFAAKLGFVAPNSFNLDESIRVLSMVVLGGMGSVPGVILGAGLIYALPETFRTLGEFRMLIFGGMMVVLMVYRPQGLIPAARAFSFRPGAGGLPAPPPKAKAT